MVPANLMIFLEINYFGLHIFSLGLYILARHPARSKY